MWVEFYRSFIVCLMICFVPGFVLFKRMGYGNFISICLSSPVSIFLILVLSELICFANIKINPLIIFIICLILVLSCGLIPKLNLVGKHHVDIDYKVVLLYIVMSLVALYVVFISQVENPLSIIEIYDNSHHISVPRAMMDSNVYSSFKQDFYMTDVDKAIYPWNTSSSFYPSGFHIITAFTAFISMCDLPVAYNAVMGVCSTVILSCGMVGLLSLVLPKRAVKYGALFTCAFTSFPWCFYLYGPLSSNLMSYSLIPAVLAMYCLAVQDFQRKNKFLVEFCLFLIGVISISMCQPNGVVSLVIFIFPYTAYLVLSEKLKLKIAKRELNKYLVVVTALVLLVLIYGAIVRMPAFAKMYSYKLPIEPIGLKQAIKFVLQIKYIGDIFYCPNQKIIGLLILLGIVYSLVHRKYLWTVLPYIFSCILLVVCLGKWSAVQGILCGIWYNDPERIAAVACLYGVVVCVLGVEFILDIVYYLFGKFNLVKLFKPFSVLLALLIACVNFGPLKSDGYFHKIQCPLGVMSTHFDYYYNFDNPLSLEEQDFIEEVLPKIDNEDSVVFNYPFDGSLWSYGTNGLRVYWRYLYYYGADNEKPESILIRKHLDEYSTNEDVRSAVKKAKGRYVLKLVNDDGTSEFVDDEFNGILSIDKNTPGFRLIAAKNGMELYEII